MDSGTKRTYNFPVYGTQGGGLARDVNGIFVFVTKPECPGLDVGDEVPEHWDFIPANDLARKREMAEFLADDRGESSFLDARGHWES